MITCEFEDGPAIRGLRHVTVDGIIMREGKVLLSKRGTYKNKPVNDSGKWGLIGGFIDRDETISEAFYREAMEEAGCSVSNLHLFSIVDDPNRAKEDRQNITFFMVADFVSSVKVETEEVHELKWFALDDLPPMELMAFDHGKLLQMYRDFLSKNGDNNQAMRFPAIVI